MKRMVESEIADILNEKLHIDENGIGRRPFELPQENPNFHREFMKSYNIPEFMSGPVKISPHEFSTLIKNSENIQATQRN